MRAHVLAEVERALALVEPFRAPPAAPASIPRMTRAPTNEAPPARGALRRELQP
ncbi:hypothetical protein [Sphingomonas parva]|uniref:hypothetical protein n=1 Tax=Sphingomonas parva TaxID=2555898 RepID=UPI00142F4436|nr:hypothetical protein [Sphingomonas parva]